MAFMSPELDSHCTNCFRPRCSQCIIGGLGRYIRPSKSPGLKSIQRYVKPRSLESGSPSSSYINDDSVDRHTEDDTSTNYKLTGDRELTDCESSSKSSDWKTPDQAFGWINRGEPWTADGLVIESFDGLPTAQISWQIFVGAVKRLLESLENDICYSIVLQACEEVSRNEPCDGNGPRNRSSAGILASASSGQPDNSVNNRKLVGSNKGSGKESSVAKAAADPLGSVTNEQSCACPYCKMHYQAYSKCSHWSAKKILRVADHVQKVHRRGPHSCSIGWQPLSNSRGLGAHGNGICQPTKGTAPEDLSVTKEKRYTCWDKWYQIRKDLFPRLRKPESPYLCESDSMDQWVQHMEREFVTVIAANEPDNQVTAGVNYLREAYERLRSRFGYQRTAEMQPQVQQATPAATEASDDSRYQLESSSNFLGSSGNNGSIRIDEPPGSPYHRLNEAVSTAYNGASSGSRIRK
ncbi:hypothetical protein F5Y15DRAFT_382844 [Xylariaceae sp. FL0016]|nr:hypothetical protein F5Y15DRAFT_382844 [Xylariaceae sp. FL0016]